GFFLYRCRAGKFLHELLPPALCGHIRNTQALGTLHSGTLYQEVKDFNKIKSHDNHHQHYQKDEGRQCIQGKQRVVHGVTPESEVPSATVSSWAYNPMDVSSNRKDIVTFLMPRYIFVLRVIQL